MAPLNMSHSWKLLIVTDFLTEHTRRPNKTIPPDGTTFNMMELGQQLKDVIPPYGYWNMQFYQSESAYVKFEVSIPRGSSIGVYGRRNALPTHTSYDFLQVLSGFKTGPSRSTRAGQVIVSTLSFFVTNAISWSLTITSPLQHKNRMAEFFLVRYS